MSLLDHGGYEEGVPPCIDAQEGISRVMGNKALYIKLLQKFTGRQMADELIEYMNDRDCIKVAQSAHTIKGLAANLGLLRLLHVVLEIEEKAKKNADVAYLTAILDETVNDTMEEIGKLTI